MTQLNRKTDPDKNQLIKCPTGIQGLDEIYLGQGIVVTGAARVIEEAKEKAARLIRQQEFDKKRRDLARRKAIAQSQIAALQAQLEAEEEELALMNQQEELQQSMLVQDRTAIAQLRKADSNSLPQAHQEKH
ncbi:hypothetical protein NUACC21_75980 [Scytonema sp. NUACC21]